jgi:hypothetical protein
VADGPEERVKELRQAVDDSARNFRVVDFWFLSVELYVFIAALSVSHDDLFFERSIGMPVINIGVPVTALFTFVPFLILVLHLNLFIQANFLAAKARRYWAASLRLAEVERRRHRLLLFPSPLSNLLTGRGDAGAPRTLLWIMAFRTAIAFPVALLMYMQVKFLPYQSEPVLWLQRSVVMLDLALVWFAWSRVLGRPFTRQRQSPADTSIQLFIARRALRVIGWGWLWLVNSRGRRSRALEPPPRVKLRWGLAAGQVVTTAALYWTIVISETAGGQIERSTGLHDIRNDSAGVLMRRFFDLSNRTLVAQGKPAPEIIAAYVAREARQAGQGGVGAGGSDKGSSPEPIEPTTARVDTDWQKYAEPLSLRGLLRYAKFVRAKLVDADLENTDLQFAWLYGTRLQGANLSGVQLEGADLG